MVASELENTSARAFYCLNLELTTAATYQAHRLSSELSHLIPKNSKYSHFEIEIMY